MSRRITPWLATTASLAALTLTLSACGSETDDAADDGGSDDSSQASADGEMSEAAAMVPQDLRDSGTIRIGTDATYAPNEFFDEDGTTIIGMDIDLFDAVADELGLETEYQSADFGSIIAGVNSDKYDIGVSSFTINEERKLEVNMVSYFNAGTQWAVAAGNPKDVDPDSPCGLAVAVQANTVQDLEDLPPKVEACDAEGNPMTVQQYDGQDQATAALASGKADAMLADSPVVSYAVQQVGDTVETVGDVYDAAPYGYVIPMESPELAEAIAMALTTLSEDGGYEEALDTWGQTDGAIDTFEVNP
ncbi:MAG: ABC transporter substrate-binding protein [Ornithinimicrobium sp.]